MTLNSDFVPHKVWMRKTFPRKVGKIHVKCLIHAAYPHFDYRAIEKQAAGVFASMEKWGFDVGKNRSGRPFVYRGDFIQFYEEAWEDEPALVEAELNAFKKRKFMKDEKMKRKNPFGFAI